MKVQVKVDGDIVLEGEAVLNRRKDGLIRLTVEDVREKARLLYFVEYPDGQYDEYLKYVDVVDNLPISAYPLSYTEWLAEQEKAKHGP